jgi:hypothetical protein
MMMKAVTLALALGVASSQIVAPRTPKAHGTIIHGGVLKQNTQRPKLEFFFCRLSLDPSGDLDFFFPRNWQLQKNA